MKIHPSQYKHISTFKPGSDIKWRISVYNQLKPIFGITRIMTIVNINLQRNSIKLYDFGGSWDIGLFEVEI